MFQEILEKLQLTSNESKIYEALLYLGLSTANEIAIKTKLQRRTIYDSLIVLKEKGLCSEILENTVKKFEPINPKRLKDILKEKEEELNENLPRMIGLFESKKQSEQTIVYKGINGIKNLYQDVLDEGKDLWVLGGRGNWLDSRVKYFFISFDKKRLNKGINYKHIFYHDLKNPKHENYLIVNMLKNNEIRFLPQDFTSTCSIEIYSNRVVSMYWGEEPLAVVIISDKIAQGYKKYFEFMWKNCEN